MTQKEPITNAEFPASEQEAREHIRQIRYDKGLGDGPDQIGNNASDLESALQVLSHDLYQTSTHFLLELIQNADDNSYDTETPTLAISYSPGRVRIDCNERGFNKSNIEAICRICKSTKSGRSKSAGFVGEKGIGFKAVFKVASVVWISSGHYNFKFNRDGHLGMIAPIWEKFPEKPGQGTSILLQLAKGTNEADIVRELEALNEKILLFLRRLRKLTISVKSSGILDLTTKPFETVLVRLPSQASDSSVRLLNNGVNKYYFVWKHMATAMPKDPRRPNISSSEIVLAFPYNLPESIGGRKRPAEPIKASQDVYAFLPIRDFGFPFLLQADFLLSANREDVHTDSPWNIALSSAAARAVAGAAEAIGRSPSNPLRYSWLAFVPVGTSQNAFFETMRVKMIAELKTSPVLESFAGNMRTPDKLIRVRPDLRDNNGRPFTMEKSTENKYLSISYDDDVHGGTLTYLGTKAQMGVDLHVEMTRILGSKPANILNKKSKEWHDALALALSSIGNNTSLWGLPIIPLRDGRWVNRRSQDKIYMADPDTEATVPEGISLLLVDTKGISEIRRHLFEQYMGVEILGVKQIKDAILTLHHDAKFKPDSLKPHVLISHLTYFYENREGTQAPRDLWFAMEAGPCKKGDHTYWPSNVPGSASSVLPRDGNSSYGFLHPAYLEYGTGAKTKKEFKAFVEDHLLVQTYTRLFINTNWQWKVHEDFYVLMASKDQNKWLLVLRDGWVPHYRFKYDGNVVVHLQKCPVRCLDGSITNSAEKTWAPLDDLVKPFGNMVPFLDIPDPKDERWEPILKGLKVGRETSLSLYLKALNTAKTTIPAPEAKIREILHLIDGLPNIRSVVGQIRTDFTLNQLIYIPHQTKGVEGRWVSPDDCYWRGESWLTQSVKLDRIYPDLETFFRTHLGVESLAGITHYMREAEAIQYLPQPVPLDRLSKILLALSKTAKNWGLSANQKESLKKLEMFPIVTSTQNEPYEYLTSVDSKKPWLIADRAHFRKSFNIGVPFLAFSPEFVLKISRLFTELGLKDRLMNGIATSVTEAHGDVKLNKEMTQKYQTRAKYLIRLMPEGQDNHRQLVASFRRVEVFTAAKIMQYWKAPLGLSQVHSQLIQGSAFLECDYAGDLRLYLRRDYEKEEFPCELAEQIRLYLGVQAEDRDLLTAALSISDERIEQLFESRGIAPLVEEDMAHEEVEEEEEEEEQTSFDPIARPVPTRKKNSRLGAAARFTRLFGPTRFSPSFFRQGNGSTNSLPSYNAAVARSTQNAIGRPAEPRTFNKAITIPSLKGALKDLDFVQTGATVIGTPANPITIFDRIRGLTQRDADIGEMIVSDILATVLGAQYDKSRMWAAQDERKNSTATFNFTDTQGRFSAFLMRLDGMPGRAQGYTRLIYHLDVKATTKDYFKITQDELDRARENSVHSQPDPDEAAPSKHVSVLVHIADVRTEPKIRFLTDPWDLFDDGQLILENAKTYIAKLNLRLREEAARSRTVEAGFDTVQFKQPEDSEEEDPSPDYEVKDGKEKQKPSKRPEMREVDSGISVGGRATATAGQSGSSAAT